MDRPTKPYSEVKEMLGDASAAWEKLIGWKHSSRRFVAADKIEKYEDIIKSQHDDIFKDVKTWGWFEKDCKISGKTSGTKVVLDSLGKLKNVS